MKTKVLKLTLICAVILTAFACKKEEESNISKYYEGNWDFKSADPDLDTTVTTFVNSDGQFQFEMEYGGSVLTVSAEVNEDGGLIGDITVPANKIGGMDGSFTEGGTGSGRFVIVNRTFLWTAKKK